MAKLTINEKRQRLAKLLPLMRSGQPFSEAVAAVSKELGYIPNTFTRIATNSTLAM